MSSNTNKNTPSPCKGEGWGEAEQQYIDLFLQERKAIDGHSHDSLNQQRDQAFAEFQRLGFPTKRDERYKYTDVAAAFAPNYGLNLNRLRIPVNPYDALASPSSLPLGHSNAFDVSRLLATFKCEVPNLSTSLYFMVNDQFYSDALPAARLPEGVYVGALPPAPPHNERGVNTKIESVVSEMQSKLLPSHYGEGVGLLNTMLAQDCLLIYIPKNTVVERPIQVMNILRADVDLMVNRRVRIVLEEGAQVKLLFCDHAADNRNFLTTQVMEVFVGERANLQLYELEETHTLNRRFSHTVVQQQAGSTTTMANITLHNGLTRNTVDVQLLGEGAETNLYGCVIADKEQHVDNNLLVDHRVPRCTSNVLYKYVLDDKATGAFAGRILVREGAQQTVSHETNANLCATPTARMYTQPMLEIYADDVQCSHGSTVGQLNDAALFYMRQRGIPEAEARMLLKFAFASEVLDTIPMAALRDRLHYLVDKRFRGELAKCEGCKLCK